MRHLKPFILLILPILIKSQDDLILDYDTAVALAQLPLECYDQEYPHKFGLTYNSSEDLHDPKDLHPIFYGCFDWHSATHGHWLLAAVINKFAGFPLENTVVPVFDEQFQIQKTFQELKVFNREDNQIFERTYGWAWLLKLQDELYKSPLDTEKGWSTNLQQLADTMVSKYKDFLPSLVYPIRAGEHANTAFGLIFAYDFAQNVGDTDLVDLIAFNATSHFMNDTNCPLSWEPSGSDFLSPCLQEAELMSRVIEDPIEFADWLQKFQPELFDEDFHLEPGQVLDATDGKLVHLHGVNFSRAWNLYALVMKLPAQFSDHKVRWFNSADEHLRASKDEIVGGDYAGTHWLASFYVYALLRREEALQKINIE